LAASTPDTGESPTTGRATASEGQGYREKSFVLKIYQAKKFLPPRNPWKTQREEEPMRIAKNDIPIRIEASGAKARQQPDFGGPAG
jgi:hypothetical protein